MNFHSTEQFAEIEAQKEESLRIFRSEQEQAWGNRKVGSHTPPDYLEKEDAAWQKHLDRLALIQKGKQAKWSLCRNCGKEKISAGRTYCAGCKRLLRLHRRRKSAFDMAQTALVSAS
jgi:hypothetical protein